LAHYTGLYTWERNMLYSLIEIFVKERCMQLGIDLDLEVEPFIP